MRGIRKKKKHIGLHYVTNENLTVAEQKRIKERELDSDHERIKNNTFRLVYFRWNSSRIHSPLMGIFMLQLCWD